MYRGMQFLDLLVGQGVAVLFWVYFGVVKNLIPRVIVNT